MERAIKFVSLTALFTVIIAAFNPISTIMGY